MLTRGVGRACDADLNMAHRVDCGELLALADDLKFEVDLAIRAVLALAPHQCTRFMVVIGLLLAIA